MLAKVIPTRVHAVLDYAVGILLGAAAVLAYLAVRF